MNPTNCCLLYVSSSPAVRLAHQGESQIQWRGFLLINSYVNQWRYIYPEAVNIFHNESLGLFCLSHLLFVLLNCRAIKCNSSSAR